MQSKSTNYSPETQHRIHQIPAGIMTDDSTTEMFGCLETRKVFGVSEGKTIPFTDICSGMRAQIFEMMLNDDIAMADLKHLPQDEALEQFTFCNYGALDKDADFCKEGELKSPDNFMCSNNCRCIFWKSKKITIHGQTLSPRKIQIIRMLASDFPDKQIADMLDMAQSTLDTHKSQLFAIFKVNSKTGLIMVAAENKIIQ